LIETKILTESARNAGNISSHDLIANTGFGFQIQATASQAVKERYA
jgi:hypothetical protein